MSVRQGGNTIAGAVGKYPLNERNISNCITNIPQDINLELSNGTLTLKAGSKVYVPNGAGVFDEVVIESDLAISGSTNQQVFVFYSPTKPNDKYDYLNSADICSGSTDSLAGVSPHCWYDTTNNLIKLFTDSSTTPARNVSFPLCLATMGNSGFISIDQVFNGFGYIGSTVFVLPGVKGLIPDGRNADGSLKNIATEVTSVQTYTYTGILIGIPSGEIYAGITSSGVIELNGDRTYNEVENVIYNSVNPELVCEFAKYRNPSGKIADFTLKTVYHALNWNDSSTISGWAMPSNRYINVTLGASGATYTAPADGWFYISATTSGTNYQVIMSAGYMSVSFRSNSLNQRMILPVSKGMIMNMNYDGTLSNTTFRFVYANGAQ